ncbi:MAG: FG-GAP-like repeat-containing protein [Gammaproteobacteria bacterium]|nr:FG-GAP-like repeat-containing protein [Gammaproteobacteria bacterium]
MMSYLKFSFFALLLVNVNFVFGQFTAVSNINAHIDSLASHGISWVDYNNDGYEDIFIATGYPDMGSALANNVLLINNGDGTFAKHTTGDLVNTQGISRNTTWADFDNDGLTDVFVANQHTTELYKNEGGGVFAKALKLPTTGVLTDSDHSGAAWGDYDNDGNVDLFLASYMLNDQAKNILYKNNGDGTFTQVLAGESISNPGNSSDPTWIDIDQNGTLDLVVPNYCSANYIFANQGDGSFQPMTDNLLTSDNCSVGTSWADYDNDGDYDVLFQNNVNQSSQLFENEGDGTFTPVVDFVSNVSSSSATWGDFNNDGWIDLIQVGAGNNSEGHTVLLQNNGDKTFSDVTVAQGITNNNYSWGVASADYDRDGFLDFYVANSYGNDQSPHDILYHNTPNANGWVNIKLTGTSANRSAIGANVRLKADGLWQMRTVQSKTGSNSQNSLHVHFGLGTASIIDTIIVQWPNGGQQQLFSQSINQFLDIQEPVFPAIPDNLVTTNNAVGEVILTWNDNASNETGYRIERSEGNQNNFSVISIVAADITTFTDTGLKEGVI